MKIFKAIWENKGALIVSGLALGSGCVTIYFANKAYGLAGCCFALLACILAECDGMMGLKLLQKYGGKEVV